MVKVLFECCENMNKYKEEIEFDDNVTDQEIEEAYIEWVLNQVSDNFTWYRKSDETGGQP